jgi:hypothetical protein
MKSNLIKFCFVMFLLRKMAFHRHYKKIITCPLTIKTFSSIGAALTVPVMNLLYNRQSFPIL